MHVDLSKLPFDYLVLLTGALLLLVVALGGGRVQLSEHRSVETLSLGLVLQWAFSGVGAMLIVASVVLAVVAPSRWVIPSAAKTVARTTSDSSAQPSPLAPASRPASIRYQRSFAIPYIDNTGYLQGSGAFPDSPF